LTQAEFGRRFKKADPRVFTATRDEIATLAEEIARVEKEIDARVAALYGLD
jgi:hypothetical protein